MGTNRGQIGTAPIKGKVFQKVYLFSCPNISMISGTQAASARYFTSLSIVHHRNGAARAHGLVIPRSGASRIRMPRWRPPVRISAWSPLTSSTRLAGRCLSPGAKVRTALIVDGYEALLRARRRKFRWDQEKRWYSRHRWRVEGIQGESKTQHGLRRAIRRGLDNVAIQVYLTAAVINLKRLAAALLHLFAWLGNNLFPSERRPGQICRISWDAAFAL